MVNESRMCDQLILHEGIELKPYKDSRGIWTVGVGFNLEARSAEYFNSVIGRTALFRRDTGGFTGEVTREEALKVVQRDIKVYQAAVRTKFPRYDELSEIRQRVVLDLAFNLGYRLAQFHETKHWIDLAIGATNTGEPNAEACWYAAAYCLMRSLWAKQVDDGLGGKFGRADRLATMLITNKDYTK